jgi:hypothetical protein
MRTISFLKILKNIGTGSSVDSEKMKEPEQKKL